MLSWHCREGWRLSGAMSPPPRVVNCLAVSMLLPAVVSLGRCDWIEGRYCCAGFTAHVGSCVCGRRIKLGPHGEELGIVFPWCEDDFRHAVFCPLYVRYR